MPHGNGAETRSGCDDTPSSNLDSTSLGPLVMKTVHEFGLVNSLI